MNQQIEAILINSVNKTAIFIKWFQRLKDPMAIAAIQNRIDRLKLGNFGDHKSVGEGVYELRITVGVGYRIYYVKQGKSIYLLTNGGDKSTQAQDIEKAKIIWRMIKQKEERGNE
ncbi:hypothetical protein BMT54_05305 [Pasteurellaceae bacterium 15-036681]|nr:hypothetical protein BMT54_05305 [Pasteurellaceae bacterium 15-036681]